MRKIFFEYFFVDLCIEKYEFWTNLMHFLYTIGIRIYAVLLHLAAPFHPKAKLWVTGRKGVFESLEKTLRGNMQQVVWMHVSSLGEFEQGRPLIEKIKEKYSQYKVVLTFFSPSGYEIRKNYPLVDVVVYLPIDTQRNAKRFFDVVQPTKVFFVKYDFWYHYLHEAQKRQVPTYLISALFRKEQLFFKSYGGFYRKILHFFDYIFVQDEKSKVLLQSIDYKKVTVSGDTRVDRVADLAENVRSILGITEFKGNQPLLVAGSTWLPDEELLVKLLQNAQMPSFKVIFAPHEVHNTHILALEKELKGANISSVRYSKLSEGDNISMQSVLIIDSIGLLSALYQYADIAYIGGGFGTGIHNTLEPAAFGLPIIFGKKYQKFYEAVRLIADGGAFSVNNYDELEIIVKKLFVDSEFRKQAEEVSKTFISRQKGATQTVLSHCFSETY